MTLQRNIAANIIGRVWTGTMGVVFVPLYVRWLGMEAFGLIGLSATLIAIFAILDLGLSTSINREFAHRHGDDGGVGRDRERDTLRSFEMIYWAMSAVIALAIILGAPFIAERWLNTGSLSLAATISAIRLMGVAIFFRWPVSLYTGALLGLRRQVHLNVVIGAYATLQGAGILVIFSLFRSGIDLFFLWQAAAAALQVALLAWITWRSVGQSERSARFSTAPLRALFGFSAGVMGITLLSIVLTQMDKVVLTRVLPLREFGYYALAGSVASILNLAAAAINSAVFPVFAQLALRDERSALAAEYHQSCQYLSVIIVPAGLALAIFAPEVLSLYLSDPAVAARTHRILSILALGNMVLGLMVLPLALQLAYGWTKLSLYKNIIAVIVFVPTLLIMVHAFGMAGAALSWLALTLCYLVGEILIMHQRLLPGEQWRWYIEDVGLPIIVAGGVLLTGKFLFPDHAQAAVRIVFLGAVGIAAIVATAMSLPITRKQLMRRVRLLRDNRAV